MTTIEKILLFLPILGIVVGIVLIWQNKMAGIGKRVNAEWYWGSSLWHAVYIFIGFMMFL